MYRGLSDINVERVKGEGLYPTPGQDWVYTATTFGRALSFAYGHAKVEGGTPVVFQLRVPVDRFHSQVAYNLQRGWTPVGYLTSGHLEPALIQEVIMIPANDDDAFKLILQKESEEESRKVDTERLLSRIPVENVET